MDDGSIEFVSEVKTVQPDPGKLPFRRLDLGCPIELKGADPDPDFQIFVSEATLETIRDYSATKLDREVGGVLMGGYYLDPEANGGKGQEFIVIDDYIPVREGQSNHASFEFSLDAWTQVTRIRNERWPDDTRADGSRSLMVGWHHTHPTFGIFLSGMDMGIQREHFKLPWQVALVVDPVRQTLGFLRIKAGKERASLCAFYLIRDRQLKKRAAQAPRPTAR